MDKKVSIVVPIYNVENYVLKCIETLTNQTYKNIEIILVNDGSTDNSYKFAQKAALTDNRIKLYTKENGGVSDARNFGIKKATGDYLILVDSDDTIDTNAVFKMVKILEKHDADMVMAEKLYYTEESGIQKNTKEIYDTIFNSEEALKYMLENNTIFVTGNLYKTNLFEGIEFPYRKKYEDVATAYKLVDRAKKIAYTNEEMYYYLCGRDGATTSVFSEENLIDNLDAHFAQFQFILKKYPHIKQYAYKTFIRMYTSAHEKMRLNNYKELFECDKILSMYNDFKTALENVDPDFIKSQLEPYRLISALILQSNRKLYWQLFDNIYTLKK